MTKLRQFITTQPAFVFLLCIFFVFHGFVENHPFIPLRDAVLLTGVYMAAATVFTTIFWIYFRNILKAAVAAFCVMAFYFFFGAAHDFLKHVFGNSVFTRYSFILPFSLLLFILLLVYLKKTEYSLYRLCFYFNSVLLLLFLFDGGRLIYKMLNPQNKMAAGWRAGFTETDLPHRPDIYFILADEYSGRASLKDLFGFDNAAFEDSLKQRGLHVIAYSRSNYNYTPFAVASILQMDYLQLQNKDRGQSDLAYCYKQIKDNRLLRFLQHNGYTFHNFSVFDFPGQPRRVNETFLPVKTRLITAQTFLSRIDRDLRFNLVTRLKSKAELKRLTYGNLHFNNNMLKLTKEIAAAPSGTPKFVYTHLMMPHYPYYFDKNGTEQPFEKLVEGNQYNQSAYIEYLQYCNKKFIELIDHILLASAQPPIIIFAGDHGFRHFREPVETDYYFQNHLSVYLQQGNYSVFPDSLTTVNLFRILLNTTFEQKLPLLKDSVIYLKD
jgi:hypothetical protein